MFGAVKGAATGITSDRKGFIERANGGTLFLDEIADMNMDAQAKVLRALEERRAYRLGERNTYAFDVRLLSATSRDLSERIAAGQFREDLYYRIAAETVYMPPLRERKEDIVALAGTMLENVTRASGKTGVTIAPEAGYWLEQYEFPGNVRELRHIVTRIASTVGRNQVVLAREVQLALGGRVRSPQIPPWRAAEHVDNLGAEPRRTGISGPAPVRRELAGALKGASDVYGHAVLKLVERALEETQRVGKDREGDLGSLSPTAAMKLLLDRPDLTTIQAADEMKRIAASAGEPAPASLFEQALGWARKLRGAGAKKRMS
jgi:transcriptional regulator with GAF, ATPase, and Fis domain